MKTEIGPAKIETTEADYEAIQKVSKIGIFQILSDQFGYWRQCNLIRISKKFKEKCEKKGVDPKLVSPKFLAQFIEAASLDEDVDIQGMWADLLAEEAQAPGTISLRTISSLKALSKDEAGAFQSLYSKALRIGGDIAIYNDRDNNNKSIEDVIRLVDCGLLVSENTSIVFDTSISPKSNQVVSQSLTGQYVIVAYNQADMEQACTIPVFTLTRAGQDILEATFTGDEKTDYFSVAKRIKDKNAALDVKLFKIRSQDERTKTLELSQEDLLGSIPDPSPY